MQIENCNPLHARKMAARLQAANVSDFPILLDYTPFRGHSPVLPLSDRIDGLTDRLAFFVIEDGVACVKLELRSMSFLVLESVCQSNVFRFLPGVRGDFAGLYEQVLHLPA